MPVAALKIAPSAGELLTPDEAGSYLKVSPHTLKRWVHLRKIEYVKMGRLVRFTHAGLERFKARRTYIPQE